MQTPLRKQSPTTVKQTPHRCKPQTLTMVSRQPDRERARMKAPCGQACPHYEGEWGIIKFARQKIAQAIERRSVACVQNPSCVTRIKT